MADQPAVVEVVGRMPYASNATFLVELNDGRRAVYKPVQGEQPLWDFPIGTLAAREVLAWEVAAAMGLDIVPETYLLPGPFGPGSVQVFIEEDFDVDPRPLLKGPSDRLWPFAVLDVVTNNADRKLGHILIEQNTGNLWAIDNGLSFHAEPKLRTILWGFGGRTIPRDLCIALEGLRDALTDGLTYRISELLSGEEAEAVGRRSARLLSTATHPLPPDDRPAVPWPMW